MLGGLIQFIFFTTSFFLLLISINYKIKEYNEIFKKNIKLSRADIGLINLKNIKIIFQYLMTIEIKKEYKKILLLIKRYQNQVIKYSSLTVFWSGLPMLIGIFQYISNNYLKLLLGLFMLWVLLVTFVLLVKLVSKSLEKITFLYFQYFFFFFAFSTFYEALNLANQNKLNFIYILVCIIIPLIPFITLNKDYLEKKKNPWETLFYGLFTFIFSEIYILLMFGIYNFTFDNGFEKYSTINSLVDFFYICIFYGGKNIYQFPNLINGNTFIPIQIGGVALIQFMLGMIFNVIIVSSLISYLSGFKKNV